MGNTPLLTTIPQPGQASSDPSVVYSAVVLLGMTKNQARQFISDHHVVWKKWDDTYDEIFTINIMERDGVTIMKKFSTSGGRLNIGIKNHIVVKLFHMN